MKTVRVQFSSKNADVTFRRVPRKEPVGDPRFYADVPASTVQLWEHINRLARAANEQRNRIWQENWEAAEAETKET